MSAEDKKAILAWLGDHPGSSAKDIQKGVGLAPKAHSAALFSMKNTGLVLEIPREDSKYPLYSINPDADPAELEDPRRIFKRKRGHHRDSRIGTAERKVIAAAGYGDFRTLDGIMAGLCAAECTFKRAYVSKLIIRLEEVGYMESDNLPEPGWRATERAADKLERMKAEGLI